MKDHQPGVEDRYNLLLAGQLTGAIIHSPIAFDINLRVAIYDSDVYALSAMNSYLAWDRRTRVVIRAHSHQALWAFLRRQSVLELPDAVLWAVGERAKAANLRRSILRLKEMNPKIHVLCVGMRADPQLVAAAAAVGVDAFLLKSEVVQQIAWAVVYATHYDLVLSPGIVDACRNVPHSRIRQATLLPPRRLYPELSDRIRQALELCVVEGMPAHLAADEMGVSLHTIRSYVKEGYRILEEQDDTSYPMDMTPRERAFMRYTALVTG